MAGSESQLDFHTDTEALYIHTFFSKCWHKLHNFSQSIIQITFCEANLLTVSCILDGSHHEKWSLTFVHSCITFPAVGRTDRSEENGVNLSLLHNTA